MPRPNRRCLAYIGTLSERFDVSIVTDVLRALPEWRLDVYGPCRYAGRGDRPAPELVGMLGAFADRVRWHGTIPRRAVPGAIDGADVIVVPIRADMAEGQSSMKLYDIAARGRPPVVARGVSSSGGEVPPGTHIADTLDEWIGGITASAVEPDDRAEARLAWARSNTWEHRWPGWASGVFGDALVAPGAGSA
jgi:glycosyltransferase involved in cell wall biosynthesis